MPYVTRSPRPSIPAPEALPIAALFAERAREAAAFARQCESRRPSAQLRLLACKAEASARRSERSALALRDCSPAESSLRLSRAEDWADQAVKFAGLAWIATRPR